MSVPGQTGREPFIQSRVAVRTPCKTNIVQQSCIVPCSRTKLYLGTNQLQGIERFETRRQYTITWS